MWAVLYNDWVFLSQKQVEIAQVLLSAKTGRAAGGANINQTLFGYATEL